MFWPETANCSVSAAIRASDSLSLARAESKVDCLFSTSVTALEISNFKRSLLWLISSSFAPRSATSAEISMSEREEAEPPRARCDANTSPSRVTTVTDLCWRKMPSASAALSATTVVDSSDVRSSEIWFERTWLSREFRPLGADVTDCWPDSYTSTSACPRFSRRSVVNALTAEERSFTTTASASPPSAAAVAASHPLSISMREAILPRICTPRESRTSSAAPSRDCEVIRIASSFDSRAFRSRSAARSASMSSS